MRGAAARSRPCFPPQGRGSVHAEIDPKKRPKAVVVGVQLPDVTEAEHESSLEELERLASTLGLQTIGRVTQKRSVLGKSAVIGEGKLLELAAWTGGDGVIPTFQRKKRKIDAKDEAPDDEADAAEDGDEEIEVDDAPATFGVATPTDKATVVLVDHDLFPSQARNLERATGAEVLDRTSVILSIFQRHARTREARLQVEIARLAYQAPRLRESGGGGDRQRGGIGGKGAGESNLELDRRKIRDRIAELREELASIEHEAGVRRKRRSEAATVALVGYTNAGKSSWMRVLTGGEVYVADKLFATLDTTVRVLVPETRPRILVSDTVGFIKKLPHDLVASFRSTLDEAREARLLLHVLDAADPAFRQQFEVTRTVLRELEADDAPSLVVLNKIDKVSPEDRAALALEFPEALQVSSRSPEDKLRLHAAIVTFFEKDMIEQRFVIPYDKQAMTSRLHEETRVLSEAYEEEGAILTVRAMPGVIAKLEKELAQSRR
ncbi:MAG: GTPase HflX [Deltaproteobacteria bacterium]|nr:GTPase HflX [Deltaproteobacteria bacterium]